jgi:hypothetical protein
MIEGIDFAHEIKVGPNLYQDRFGKAYSHDSVLKGIMKTSNFGSLLNVFTDTYEYTGENIEQFFGPPGVGTTSDVKITVIRGPRFVHSGRSAAYGKLYVNGEYWFDTGERSMVTPGTYPVAFRKETGCTMTGRSDWLRKGKAGDPMRRFAVYSKGYVPLVLGTKGRGGIRIHQGTSVGWSEGCLITGNLRNGKLENSWECWKRLYDYCYNAKSVTITYQG